MAEARTPLIHLKLMASISSQGIWIDCKQLMKLTYQLLNHLSNKDRLLIGDRLMKANIDMVEAFAMAYKRGDEKLTYDDGEVYYEAEIKGCKRVEIDRLSASFEQYKALWEFIFENVDIQRMSDEQKERKEAEFVRMLAKVEIGINRWRSGVHRQVIVSRKRHDVVQAL